MLYAIYTNAASLPSSLRGRNIASKLPTFPTLKITATVTHRQTRQGKDGKHKELGPCVISYIVETPFLLPAINTNLELACSSPLSTRNRRGRSQCGC